MIAINKSSVFQRMPTPPVLPGPLHPLTSSFIAWLTTSLTLAPRINIDFLQFSTSLGALSSRALLTL